MSSSLARGAAGLAASAGLLLSCACSTSTSSTPALSINAPTDGSIVGDAARRIDTRANLFTISTQEQATVAMARDGRTVLAWESRRQHGGRPGVYARTFDALGRPTSGEIELSASTGGFQARPSVAIAGDGSVWAAWSATGPDGSSTGIIARRFDAAMNPLSGDLGVNEVRDGEQSGASIAAGADGSALVTWTNAARSDATAVSIRAYSADGSASGPEISLSSDAAHRDSAISIAKRPAGGYLAVWARAHGDGRPMSLVGRRLSATGQPEGPEFAITDSAEVGIEPSLSVDSAGRFAVAWMSPIDDGYVVRARVFDAEGNAAGAALTVSGSIPGFKSGASVALHDSGLASIAFNAFAIRETADGGVDAGQDLYRVDVDLHAATPGSIAEPRLVFTETSGDQAIAASTGAARMAVGSEGQLAIAWSGHGGDDDKTGARLALEMPEPLALRLTDELPQPAAFDSSVPNTIIADTGMIAEPHIPPVFDPNWQPQGPAVGSPDPDADFGFEAVPGTGWTPPDPEMAVGPNHIVVIVNGQIAYFDKSGANLFRDEIEGGAGFWGPQGAGGFVFDPEALYDASTGRFMVMANERTGGQSFFLLAVSDDSNPVGTWHKYRFNVTALAGGDIDSPNFAFDANSITLTADFFSPDDFLVFTVDKAAALAGAPSPTTRSLLINGSHSYGVPAMYGPAPAQYLLQSFESTSNTSVRFHAIQNPLTTPTRVSFDLTVPAYRFPTPPPQQGTSTRPTLFEPRFWSCAYHNGSLWAVHHITTATDTTRTRIRWYQFAMNGWPTSGSNPSLVQTGDVVAPGNNHAYFPSIDADDQGNAAITFARSGPTEFIGMWRTLRRHADAPGTFREQTLVKASTSAFTTNRWGDYSATRIDPAQGCVFWGHHEWTTSSGSWRTWVGKYENYAAIDYNKDCLVDFADYLLFLNFFDALDPAADLNGDGLVDFSDYLEFLNQYDLEQ